MKKLSNAQMKALKALNKTDILTQTANELGARVATMNSLTAMGLVGRKMNSMMPSGLIDKFWRKLWLWYITEAGKQYLADGRTEALLLSETQWNVLAGLYSCDGMCPPARTLLALERKGLVCADTCTITELGRKLVDRATL